MKSNTRIMALDRRVSAAMALAAAAALILLLFTGCEENPFAKGSEIKFQAGSGPATKTEYGEIVGTAADKVQRVDWLSGDQLRICCAAASAPSSKYADYRIKEGTITTDGALTKAKITPVGSGLQWGSTSDAHNFYGLYPSPATGKTGDAIDKDGKMQGKVPATQTPDEIVIPEDASKPIVAKPVMTNQYMVAKATKAAGIQTIADDEVVLYFTPITTAIEFTVKNNYEDNQTLRIKSVSLISTSHNLSGSFSTDLLNDWSGTYPTTASGTFSDLTKEVKIDFTCETDGFVSLAKGNMLNFTFFLLPNTSPDDLVFKIVKQKADGEESDSYMKAAIVDKDGNGVEFDRCKKHFVSGVLLEDGAVWTVGFDPDVFSWDVLDPVDKTLEDPTAAEPSGLVSWDTGDEDDLELKAISYEFKLENPGDATKTFSNPTETSSYDIPVTSVKTESGTPDENHSWAVKSYTIGSGSPVTVTGNTFTIENLTVVKNGKKLEVTDNRPAIDLGDNSHWTTSGSDWYRPAKSGTTDLSKYLFRTDANRSNGAMITANCYIVRNAGTYKIPLVYGNAIVNNNTNSSAYTGTTGTNALATFVNHLGYGIRDPFIENNLTTGNSTFRKQDRLVASSASVLWQEYNVISSVSVTSTSVPNNACNYSNCGYITFTISQADIRQSNAIIAVKDASGNIMWSWHIWITNDPALSQDAVSFGSYDFLPAPCLGWIEPPFYEEKSDIVVTLVQEETDETLDVTVKRPKYRCPGTGTYYQFGRKDPMPSKDNVSGAFTKETSTKNPTTFENGIALKTGILWPHHFWCRKYESGDWCSTRYDNLWTGTLNTTNPSATGAVKTVYDPCPVGYMVPVPSAFSTGFCDVTDQCYDKTKWHVVDNDMSKGKGYRFGTASSNKFFPAAGRRAYQTGDISNAGQNAFFVYAIPLDPSNNPIDAEDGERTSGLYVYGFGFNANHLWVHDYFARGNGLSISPVKQ